jgi:cell division transport system permease protein
VSNIISGIIAAIVATGLLVWLLYYVSQALDISTLIDVYGLLIVFGSVFCLGILISVIATHIAVNKYIRMDSNDLYFI